MIVAIDGPAGTGKGTIASLISKRLGFTYIDTGAMYRCVTLKMIRKGVKLDAHLSEIENLLKKIKIEFMNISEKQHIFLDDEDVTEEIRTPEVSALASPTSQIQVIRDKLLIMQREYAKDTNVVMEGRDITTVVFPNADIKIYLTATAGERAQRRYKELVAKGIQTTYEETLQAIMTRDENDMNRKVAPLMIAKDAIVIDTTYMSIEEVYDKVHELITDYEMSKDM